MGDLKATYRLQLRPHLDFAAARSQVPYLTRLGISHLYLSPLSGWIREARNVSIA
jgi:maltooligosyltrehalose synthase